MTPFLEMDDMLHREARPAFATDADRPVGRRRSSAPRVVRSVMRSVLTGRLAARLIGGTGLGVVGLTGASAVLLAWSPAPGLTATADAAQARPDSIVRLATRPSLSAADTQRIEAYANYWADRLAGGGDDAPEAAQRLLEPLGGSGLTQSFRNAYANALVPRMRTIAREPKTAHAAVNSVIITTQLGTTSALGGLREMADPRRQDRWNVRLAAARGVGFMLKTDRDRNRPLILPQDRVDAARAIADTVRTETDPRVLRRSLSAIILADATSVAEANRREIHRLFAEALANVAARGKTDLPIAMAAGDAVFDAREAYFALTASPSLQVAYSQQISGPLTELLDAFGQNWSGGSNTSTSPENLLPYLKRTETCLGFVVALLNPRAASAELPASDAWDDRARTDFDSAIARYRSAIGG